MRASESIAIASERLSARHVPDATLEAEVLLRHVIDVSRAQLYASLDRPLGERWHAVARRKMRLIRCCAFSHLDSQRTRGVPWTGMGARSLAHQSSIGRNGSLNGTQVPS